MVEREDAEAVEGADEDVQTVAGEAVAGEDAAGEDAAGEDAAGEDAASAGGGHDDGEGDGTRQDGDDASAEPSAGQAVTLILNAFHDAVTADGATFGVTAHGASTPRGTGDAPETGRLDSAVVSTTVERYVRPAPYADALRALAEDRVVVLAGPRGCGKRTGAIALLRDVLPADAPIVSLSPTATLEELAGKSARKKGGGGGRGLVVFDRLTFEQGREADHRWEVLCGKVREAGDHLVITTWEQDRRVGEAVRRIVWERPDPARALRAHLDGAATDEVIAEIVAALPADHAMSDLVAVARRVAVDRASPRDAVAAVFDQSERRAVEEWFDGAPTLEEILDITTLAFASQLGVRDFEGERARLQDLLAATRPRHYPQEPAGVQDGGAAAEPPPAVPAVRSRGDRLLKHALIKKVDVVDGVRRKSVAFREQGYRRLVLERLSDECGVEFWDAVRLWLHQAVKDDAWRLRIASGLALLAHSHFDEVEQSYLDPWSSGRAGVKGRDAAAATLWFMCLDEELRPIALRTAVRWASYGSREARRTAIVAFVGELGMRYPTEASRRLWQLVEQPGDLSALAADAFGDLFAGLVARDGGRQVVNRLSGRVDGRGDTRKDRRRTYLRAALAVVSARDPGTGRPAIVRYIRDRPEETPVVARMWAALLRHRPVRARALTALHDGLDALEPLASSAAEASGLARCLGVGLRAALPEPERAALARDLARRVRNRGRVNRSAALVQILIRTLDRTRPGRKE
ncbi:hypothetical protein Acsp04_28270 [Actinomadura sp. NBRC 104425]|uniref:hypothetical protein n=1 Tax=Actinomadura sp. NBRC 104425 TaxID=3032204 RepID=UPI0024A436AC|nr:hypothetical protein [Actinomadura sp. NBRC 104425]GLZ12592.1 hypothetical protein Acsp04_28270 [Actinomadura sp. NBRC 104425]